MTVFKKANSQQPKRNLTYLCFMRLTEDEIKIIKSVIHKYEPGAQIRLFGSRTDDKLRGGDIDILIISKFLNYRDKLRIRAELKEKLGDRKMDIIITEKPETAFTRHAFKHSMSL